MKIKKISAAVMAAAIAFGSMAAYVASAAVISKNEVTLTKDDNTLTFSAMTTPEGTPITVHVTPEDGYNVTGVTITYQNSDGETTTDNATAGEDNTYTFTVPAVLKNDGLAGDVTITAVYEASGDNGDGGDEEPSGNGDGGDEEPGGNSDDNNDKDTPTPTPDSSDTVTPPDSNPSTGIGYAFVPAVLAAGALIASTKKRK